MLILPPFMVGQTATLCAPREYTCTVTAPDDSEVVYETPTKRTDIPLTMVGTYRYEFSDGSTGELVVIDANPVRVVIP